jgi:antitoxin component YwqK of YwqJK toxin-antitoxin module
MKTLIIFLALAAAAVAIPPVRITNREYPDGSGSSRETDPSKQQSTETFYDSSRRMTHKAVYKLDERLAPLSAIFYNAKGIIYQKSTYRLDGEDRIIQEVIYDARGNLLGTKNYSYGTRNGKDTVVNVDTYDANGNLVQTPRLSKSSRRTR